MNSSLLKNTLLTILVFFIFIGGLHMMLLEYVLPESYKRIDILYIYIFLLCLSEIGVLLLFLVSKNDETLIGKGFLTYTVIKILGSLVFLLPGLLNQDDFTKPFIYQFFGIFFPSLIIETLVILRLVNANTSKK